MNVWHQLISNYLPSRSLANTSMTGSIPGSLGNLVQLSILDLNGTSLTCPPDNTPCVAQQQLESAFCRQCPSFCTTCIKPGTRPPTPSPGSTTASPSPPTASPPPPPSPASSSSQSGGLSAAAIAGITVAAVASLLLLLVGGLLCWRRYKKEAAAGDAAAEKHGQDAVLQVQTDSDGLGGNMAASHCTEYSLEEVESCLSSNTLARLKDLSMDAPDDAVLRLAQLALSCTVERTASRPSMADVVNELQGIRNEVVGKVELPAAAKADERAQEMRDSVAVDTHLQCVDKLLQGDSFEDEPIA
ncbi:unnamed protein product [Closterium sp. Naga37s-1]|nr:unnamed protein product [Closterium sp. Naga37s-1]